MAPVDTEQFGNAVIQLGGGWRIKSDTINPSDRLEMLVRVKAGQPLLHVFAEKDAAAAVLII